VKECPINQPQNNDDEMDEIEDSSMFDEYEEDIDTEDSHRDTSFNIDRMASDGENVLYTSYYDARPDLIAYCLMDDDNNDADEYRDWNQSRIKDMIWWNSIGKFICATGDGVYTVDYANRRFKILCVIREKWSFIRVAANTHQLFIWMQPVENDFNGIEIYSPQFACIRIIDFNTDRIGNFVNDTASFCVTDNFIASICTRKQNNREVFQVTFCDMNMNKLRTLRLGRFKNRIEIRADEIERFFITTGLRRFYIVYSNGAKQVINLQNDSNYIAVLSDQRVAVSNQNNSMEILTY
jgi:hypothetical protein